MKEEDIVNGNEKDTLDAKQVSAEISRLVQRKRALEEKLVALERQIYALEGSYLQDTCHVGNILTGWDNYLTSRGSGALKRQLKFKESDRVFSLSSVTSLRSNDTRIEPKSESHSTADRGSDDDDVRPYKHLKMSKKGGPGRPRKSKNFDYDDEYLDSI